MRYRTLTRRTFLAATAATGLLPTADASAQQKKIFTILHTNDLHSNLIGFGPASDYTPFTLGDDKTVGGFARLAAVIRQRKAARETLGPVLILDAGDYSMGTAYGGAIRETGAELLLLARMGCDVTTFGNHDFDLGPDGLGRSIAVAANTGPVPLVLASNTNFQAAHPTLIDLQRLAKDGIIRRHVVVERGGIRFGIFGVLGQEAAFFALGAGAAKFSNAVDTAKEVVKLLREQERADVIICLSHGGMERGKDGRFLEGEDVRLARAVPEIDVVVGAHSHTALQAPVIVNERTPVVQAGKYGENLGELVLGLDGGKLTVESYRLHPIDDTILGDRAIAEEIDKLNTTVNAVVLGSRGYRIDQPLAVVPQDLPNASADIAASTLLANLVTDAYRNATKADIAFTANGLLCAGLNRGKSGVQTVYDVFAVTPLGAGLVDNTAGSALMTVHLTGRELKTVLEFCLMDVPTHPGELFPRTSGMRFRYDLSRAQFDVVTAIEIGNVDDGYRAIDITGKDPQSYSIACPLFIGQLLMAIPKATVGKLKLVPKHRDGQPLMFEVDALRLERRSTPDLLPSPGTVDKRSLATADNKEIKEWQAVMDYLRALPKRDNEQLPTIPVDSRAAEVRAIKIG